MKNIFLVISAIVFAFTAKAQMTIHSEIRSSISSTEDLPFWMTANQNGIYPLEGNHSQLANIGVFQEIQTKSKNWNFDYGADLWYSYNGKSDFQINQLFGDITYQWIKLKVGAKHNAKQFNGLSSTNQDINWSNNARALPGILLSTNGFTPLKKGSKWSFYAEYGENGTGEDRVVENAFVHQKKLHFLYNQKQGWSFEIGLDHYAQWGGTHETKGELPCSFEEYWRTVLGMSGGKNSLGMDQANVAGNSFGSYIINISKETKTANFKILYNHFFRDASGMEYENWQDGFYAFTYENKREYPIIKRVAYEFTYSKDQSGDTHLKFDPETGETHGRGQDDYYNHGIYSSGWTYKNYSIGSPFWIPTVDENGISRGYNSTRLLAHYFGLEGFITPQITWKGIVSYSKNYGSYWRDIEYDLHQTSFACTVNYQTENKPLSFSAKLAGDYGTQFEHRAAVEFGVKYKIK